MLLHNLLLNPEAVDLVFAKILSSNDDTGKHGVVIPAAAYDFFPPWPAIAVEPDKNADREHPAEARDGGSVLRTWMREKYYERYPERRLTFLTNVGMASGQHRLLVVGRRTDVQGMFEVHPIDLQDVGSVELLQELGLDPAQPEQWVLVRPQSVGPVVRDPGVEIILNAFDAYAGAPITVPRPQGGTFRPKEVGMLAQRVAGKHGEDNHPGPDIGKTELKGMLAGQWRDTHTPGDAKLFLKEPEWVDGLTPAARVKAYGYLDAKRRQGLKVAVRAGQENAQGFELRPHRVEQRLELLRHGKVVGLWTLKELEERLRAKLTTTVFVLASRTETEHAEAFSYHTLLLAENPSGLALLDLIAEGEISVQLRMHHDGASTKAIRNRGTQFRINKRATARLFGRLRVLRDYKKGAPGKG